MMADAAVNRRAFLLRKFHSLTGVVPLGAFLVEHLWTNASALGGQAAFDAAVARIQSLPGLLLFEVVGIALPLLFHAGFGVAIALRGRANVLGYPYARNWLYVLQRVSGIVALGFIAFHLWEFRFQTAYFALRKEDFYPTLVAHLSATRAGVPWAALLYVVGIGATVFHFANGMWGFCASWGVCASKRAQGRAGWLFGALGAGLFLLGLQTVVFFATGSRILLPAPAEQAVPLSSVPCPSPSAPFPP